METTKNKPLGKVQL